MTTPRRPYKITNSTLQYDKDGPIITYSHHKCKWTPDQDAKLFNGILRRVKGWCDGPRKTCSWAELREDVPGKTADLIAGRIRYLQKSKMLPPSVAKSIEKVEASGGDADEAQRVGLKGYQAAQVIRTMNENPNFENRTTLEDIKKKVVEAGKLNVSGRDQNIFVQKNCRLDLICRQCETQQETPTFQTLLQYYNHGSTYQCTLCPFSHKVMTLFLQDLAPGSSIVESKEEYVRNNEGKCSAHYSFNLRKPCGCVVHINRVSDFRGGTLPLMRGKDHQGFLKFCSKCNEVDADVVDEIRTNGTMLARDVGRYGEELAKHVFRTQAHPISGGPVLGTILDAFEGGPADLVVTFPLRASDSVETVNFMQVQVKTVLLDTNRFARYPLNRTSTEGYNGTILLAVCADDPSYYTLGRFEDYSLTPSGKLSLPFKSGCDMASPEVQNHPNGHLAISAVELQFALLRLYLDKEQSGLLMPYSAAIKPRDNTAGMTEFVAFNAFKDANKGFYGVEFHAAYDSTDLFLRVHLKKDTAGSADLAERGFPVTSINEELLEVTIAVQAKARTATPTFDFSHDNGTPYDLTDPDAPKAALLIGRVSRSSRNFEYLYLVPTSEVSSNNKCWTKITPDELEEWYYQRLDEPLEKGLIANVLQVDASGIVDSYSDEPLQVMDATMEEIFALSQRKVYESAMSILHRAENIISEYGDTDDDHMQID